ncbi:MAG: hypothetical protein K8S27_09585 [Candidatus Omnitrophica bacterium]|nr:hypothetical protein [Candidatus Omnitrophota bacterium]
MVKGKIIQNKNFCIYIDDKKSFVALSFIHLTAATYTFKLTRIEWKNLLGFIKQTLSYKKTILCGFDIKNNKYRDIPLENLEKELVLTKTMFGGKAKEFRAHKSSVNKIKKYCLNESIFLQKNGTSANLDRNKFIQFRKFCLSNASKIKIV